MRTAEGESAGAPRGERRWVWAGLLLVLLGGLALRLWGVRQGLPYVYNIDEATHFVPRAVEMFQHGLDPHYFANPPAFTYLLHGLYALWYGGGAGASRALALNPTEVYTLARVAAGLLGTAALWLLYAAGGRLFSRPVGLLAAAILAVAFLPVFYSHLAVNDVPTLAPLTLCLLGGAGILRRGLSRDYVLAGIGLGLACASKYTAGIVILPMLAAAGARWHMEDRPGRRRTLGMLVLALVLALAAFVLANPYSVIDYSAFHSELVHQSTLSAESQGKLGAPRNGGLVYYLWTLTWGLGWLPALAALGGAILIWRRDARVGWMLVPAPLIFLAFMGLQGRYFGRWLLPIFPILALLGAFFAVELARAAARRMERRRWIAAALTGVLVAALLAQGLIYSVHSGIVLSRTDTRTTARQWMLANVPEGSRIVAEPISPDAWAREEPGSAACHGYRWCKYDSLLSRITPSGALTTHVHEVGIEDYERTLSPQLLGYYTANGYCWVLTGSTESGRAQADPGAVPGANAYYRALAREGELVFTASPYAGGAGPVPFGFDWSFDYYPLAYGRPGPTVSLYRLHGGRCGT
jgi:4-amino-4-deoxy-L-arabinose transferase-like glycosyltransferase